MAFYVEPIVLRAGRTGKGNGLFATREYAKGERVLHELSSIIDRPLQFVNHSCEPNCDIQLLMLVARRRIKKGEEITMDYATVQFQRKKVWFDCQCGSEKCRGRVR